MSEFNDVGDFHRKFGLPAVPHTTANPRDRAAPREISAEARDFRLRFLLEELEELAEGYGLELTWELAPLAENAEQDLPKIADSLVDLVYVALGTAHTHGLPWPVLWDDVQRANLSKERARPDGSDSQRRSALDVVKPENWKGPDTLGILMEAGWPGRPLPL